jgi:hypothetical protein
MIDSIGILANRQCTLTFHSHAGESYRIEASSDTVAWLLIGKLVATGGLSYFLDTEAPHNSPRFYRVAQVPAHNP